MTNHRARPSRVHREASRTAVSAPSSPCRTIGRLGNDIALGNDSAAVFAAFIVLAFFAGGVLSSIVLERGANIDVARAYGIALAIEAIFLCAFIFIAGMSGATHPRVLDAEAALLSAAMGMQKALVTRLSGAVVRTTHRIDMFILLFMFGMTSAMVGTTLVRPTRLRGSSTR